MKTQKYKLMAALTGLALATGSALAADSAQRGQLSSKDYDFLVNAVRGNTSEVQLGELAKQKAGNQQIRDFGDRMISDHNKANDELKRIASQKGATLPADLTFRERTSFEHLQKVTGKDFDKSYARDMAKDHKKDVKEFEEASRELSDADLKGFADKTLPTLQEHLRMAEALENTVKTE